MYQRSAVVLFIGCVVSSLAIGQSSGIITVRNPLNTQHAAQVVEVPVQTLLAVVPSLVPDRVVVTSENNKKTVLQQLVDTDGDGRHELLLLGVSLGPKESQRYLISAGTPQQFPSLVDGRFVRPREDFAWENDRIAFRMYGPAMAADVNNGIDVWTKRVRHLIVDKWYKGEEKEPKISYHTDHGEGADFFSVGKSLGCGGLGVMENGELRQGGVFSTFRVIANGPLRVSFELVYDRWILGGTKATQIKRITLDAGSNLSAVEDRFMTLGKDDPLTIAAGLATRKGATIRRSDDNRWLTLWGPTNDDPANGSLGTAVVFPTKSSAAEDSLNWMITTTAIPGRVVRSYVGAAWTRSGDIATSEDWNAMVGRYLQSIDHPLEVSITKR